MDYILSTTNLVLPEINSSETDYKILNYNQIIQNAELVEIKKLRWSGEEIEFLIKNYRRKKTDWKKINNKINRSRRAITIKASRLGLSKKQVSWTSEEIRKLRRHYINGTKNIFELSDELNKTVGAIRQKLHRSNIQKKVFWKKYKINYAFFKKWTKESAYVMGFTAADGCLNSQTGHYNIELSSKDKTLLEKIRKIMQFSKPVEKERKTFRLRIDNKIIYQDLNKLGIHPKKSKKIKFPPVPEGQLNHFIRGFFDGDGSIYKLKNRRIAVKFSCWSPVFLQKLQKIISKKCDVSPKKNYDHSILYYSQEAIKVLRFLYKNTDNRIRLKRKYNRFKKFTEEAIPSVA